MKLVIKKPDETQVEVAHLVKKLTSKMEERDEEGENLCANTAVLFTEHFINRMPLLHALLTVNQNILKIFSIYLQAGYLLGRAIERNQLKIHVIKEDNDNTADTSKGTPDSITNSN